MKICTIFFFYVFSHVNLLAQNVYERIKDRTNCKPIEYIKENCFAFDSSNTYAFPAFCECIILLTTCDDLSDQLKGRKSMMEFKIEDYDSSKRYFIYVLYNSLPNNFYCAVGNPILKLESPNLRYVEEIFIKNSGMIDLVGSNVYGFWITNYRMGTSKDIIYYICYPMGLVYNVGIAEYKNEEYKKIGWECSYSIANTQYRDF